MIMSLLAVSHITGGYRRRSGLPDAAFGEEDTDQRGASAEQA
jgi:hypothetical protein